MNAEVVSVQQTYEGIPVYNAGATFLIKENNVSYFSDNFLKNYKTVNSSKASLDKNTVFGKISQNLSKKSGSYKILEFIENDLSDNQAFAKGKLIYYNTDNGDLKLCYEFEFEEKGTSNYWDVIADANTGEILSKNNLTVSDNFIENPYKSEHLSLQQQTKKTNINSKIESKINIPAIGKASYNVFALPLEAPSFGSRSVVTNPWFLDASPNGWQNDNNATYTITRGNNVYAYDDKADSDNPGTHLLMEVQLEILTFHLT